MPKYYRIMLGRTTHTEHWVGAVMGQKLEKVQRSQRVPTYGSSSNRKYKLSIKFAPEVVGRSWLWAKQKKKKAEKTMSTHLPGGMTGVRT